MAHSGGKMRRMSTATETAARMDVLTAAVCAMALAMPPEAARVAGERLHALLANLNPAHGNADAAAAGTLAQVLTALGCAVIRTTPVVVSLALLALAAAPTLAKLGDRSQALRAEFQRMHPCPSTGKTRGACPGYQVDHREALVCGGRDELGNLQWLTIDEHRAKTRAEVKLCRARRAG